MTTTVLPLSAGLIMISSLSCIFLRADLSVCVQLSVLGICTSTLCLISDLIRSMTDNVIYLLDCGSQCVGESVQPFNKRMNGHRSDLTKKTLLPVSQHFVSPGHSMDDFVRSKIYIIDHNAGWKENQRHKRESFWIRELQTLHRRA